MNSSRFGASVALIVSGLSVSAGETPRFSPLDSFGKVERQLNRAGRAACRERENIDFALLSVTAAKLLGDVNMYEVLLKVGPGEFDVIRLTRVVREASDDARTEFDDDWAEAREPSWEDEAWWQQPGGHRERSPGVLFIHGSGQTFADSFINRSTLPENPGIAAWLAQRGVDVWGIDLRFAQIPSTATNFDFMADWDYGVMVDDIRLGTRLARHVRTRTGKGYSRLHLSGRSLGASLAYAVARSGGCRASLRPRRPQGIIPIESIYVLPPTDTSGRAAACNAETAHANALASGVNHIDGRPSMAVGVAARENPTGPSTNPQFNNLQLALNAAASRTFPTAWPLHIAAVLFDAAGLPTDGRFTDTTLIVDALADQIPFRSRAIQRDFNGIPCGTRDYPYDDNLAHIVVPSLYVGVAGGYGVSGLHTNTLLGSRDKAAIFIQLLSSDQAVSDFGHIEAFTAAHARTLVWEPVLAWMKSH